MSNRSNVAAVKGNEAPEDKVTISGDPNDMRGIKDDCGPLRDMILDFRAMGMDQFLTNYSAAGALPANLSVSKVTGPTGPQAQITVADKDPSNPANPYSCYSALVLDTSNLALVGNSKNSDGRVRFRLFDNALSPLVVIGTIEMPDPSNPQNPLQRVTTNVTVQNFDLDGNRTGMMNSILATAPLYQQIKAQRDVECWGAGSPCDTYNRPTSFIRNNGVTIRRSNHISVKNVGAHDWSSGGLVTEKLCDHLTIENFESFKNIYDGFAGYQTNSSTFTGLNLHDNFSSGASIDDEFDSNTFQDANFHDNLDNGIFARRSKAMVWNNTKITNNCNFGVYMAAAGPGEPVTNWTFNGLAVTNSGRGYAGSGRSGIRLPDTSCTNNTFSSTTFANNPGGDARIAVGLSAQINGAAVVGVDPLAQNESSYKFDPACDAQLGVFARPDTVCYNAGGYIKPGGTVCVCPGRDQTPVASLGGVTCTQYLLNNNIAQNGIKVTTQATANAADLAAAGAPALTTDAAADQSAAGASGDGSAAPTPTPSAADASGSTDAPGPSADCPQQQQNANCTGLGGTVDCTGLCSCPDGTPAFKLHGGTCATGPQ